MSIVTGSDIMIMEIKFRITSKIPVIKIAGAFHCLLMVLFPFISCRCSFPWDRPAKRDIIEKYLLAFADINIPFFGIRIPVMIKMKEKIKYVKVVIHISKLLSGSTDKAEMINKFAIAKTALTITSRLQQQCIMVLTVFLLVSIPIEILRII